MATVTRSALVSYSAEQMFALVADVPTYHEFLPMCSGSRSTVVSTGVEDATVEMSIAGLSKSFTTRNTLEPSSRIGLSLVDGPFSDLEGEWRFENIADEGSRVSLSLEFEFASRLLAMAVGPVFETLTNSMIDAFTERAGTVYGGGDNAG